MPVTTPIDWTYAQMLFVQGVSHVEIARQLGVKSTRITQHAHRHGWKRKLTAVRQVVTDVMQRAVKTDELTIQARAQAWIAREADKVEETTDVLNKVAVPKTIQKAREYLEVRNLNSKWGRSTFGLDQAGAQVQVNVGVRIGDLEVDQPSTTLDSQSSAEP